MAPCGQGVCLSVMWLLPGPLAHHSAPLIASVLTAFNPLDLYMCVDLHAFEAIAFFSSLSHEVQLETSVEC